MFSVVIPVYNEEDSLRELCAGIATEALNLEMEVEIVFVNDGSSDGTQEIIESLSEEYDWVKYIVFRKNFGKSAALSAGFKQVTHEIVFTMDADLQDDPCEIPKFLEAIERGADVVTGWKKNRFDPIEKTLPSKLFNFITSKFSGLKLHDYNCGFKCYRRDVLEEIEIYGELHRFIPFLAHKKGFTVAEVPVVHHPRKFGHSKFGIERYARGFFDLLTVIFITNYLTRPLHFFGPMGALFCLSGLGLFAYLFLFRWLVGVSIGSSPLFSLSILAIGVGFQIITGGLLAELFVHHREKRGRATYAILRAHLEGKVSDRQEQ
nr:glycosyltransferase family 2 protein [uncultured Desulfobulbus sp.]